MVMNARRYRIAAVAIMSLMVMGLACAQEFPAKPIRIVTAPPGGGADFVARIVAQGTGASGWQVVVDGRPGALRAEVVAKAAADGYTLLLDGNNLWISPFLEKMAYDYTRDFSPVTLVDTTPLVLVVHASLPVKSVQELIALARARPGQLNYASSPVGSPTQLAAELFKSMAGINLVFIPYKGAGQALGSLMSGETEVMFPTSGQPELKSPKLRALAVTSRAPSPLATGLPTLAQSGLPGYEAVNIHGIFAPAGTPIAVVGRLNQEFVRVLKQPEVRERLLAAGLDPAGSSPQELAAVVNSDLTRMSKVIRDGNIKTQ
jgi:tripartite-type tricarboxylate transporter receptor subunit TctC